MDTIIIIKKRKGCFLRGSLSSTAICTRSSAKRANEWQLAHIEEGLRQAEAGEFATDDEIRAAFDLGKSGC
jgi:predicted transcriptional regulator